jgi:hypothetical protein
MASLRDLQYSFAAALRDPDAACAVTPNCNLQIYRNNGEMQFRGVLAISFPVLRRRVGDGYFNQLAHEYRRAHPSRSGDLHWVGRDFAEFLGGRLEGTEYAWLADLARLEWLCELAAIAAPRPALGVDALAAYAPDQLERLRLALQPSLGLHRSDFPVFTVWLANQAAEAPPVDQSVGAEHGMVHIRDDAVEVRRLEAPLFSHVSALAAGLPLGEAFTAAQLDEPGLLSALRFIFAQGLVCGISAPT